ncbi:hypothetical protein ACI78R_20610 [Geodermatophilus sp. SYSU D01106]
MSAPVTGAVDADRVAAALAAVPGVAGLTAGPAGAGTYLPGRRVDGVVLTAVPGGRPDRVTVHVVAAAGTAVREVAAAVREAVAAVAPGSPVDVVVEDVVVEDVTEPVPVPAPVPPAPGGGRP